MSPPIPPRVYSLLRSARPVGARNLVVGLIVAAFALGALGIMRVARRHEVVKLGASLSQKTDELRKLAEARGLRQPTAGQVRVVRSRTQVAERR